MPLTVAKTAGFCFGVRRAVDTVYEQLERIPSTSSPKLFTLGEIIHNAQVVEELDSLGAVAVDSLEKLLELEEQLSQQNRPYIPVIIRSHGVPKKVYEALDSRSIPYIDATCPNVKRIQKIVEEQPEGTLVLIAGDAVHPEIQGIIGHCNVTCVTFTFAKELAEFTENHANLSKMNSVMVAQTTFNTSEWQKCVETAKNLYTNLKIFDTICKATLMRQTEAAQLAEVSDIMIVIGGRHSSNTQKLSDICSRFTKTIWVETARELLSGQADVVCQIDAGSRVGVTAGASTPVRIIKEVQKTMSEILKEEEMSFEEMLNQSFKSTYTGEKVKGIVTGIAPNEITVDIGTKHTGYVPLSELTNDPSLSTEDIVKKGDEIELVVLRVNDVEGTVMLSKKRLDAQAGFEKVMAAAGTGEVLSGTVTDVVKGGILAVTEGVKVFIPASLSGVSKNEPLEQLLKQKVDFVIREVNEKRHRAVGSIKDVLKEQKKVLEDKFWSEVEVGKRYQGVVKSITSYGAFVDLGGVDGMVHISELSWLRIKHPSDVVKVGDVLDVYVKDIDVENKKISLGYKKTEDNPWEVLKRDYEVGSVVTAKVVSMTAFGAFAQIIPGVDGLIHISQISNERINKPQDVLTIGQEVQVQITDIDFEKKRVSLSMKALLEDNAQEEAVEASEETTEVNE
ncbi:bifunctional 4-hydroxy-3-methylbut-2-enyl diphosphate reductase/30S ribosomal protein S1 [Negativibacillus massiliensis]|uniref:bifunctional 4-hydroxy-3-methylbut-2-enyl diphosphate reductase/30S ribosomal protein S1 n=1 Tax=Negativibacillus massiliensis TaxID=1871035 RepID=UPI002A807086|nr:bifunctional 4-hydroxy-3-methylbut-2-enyl diphosphate reductase/30S ribosomal protein S1 [Negativibacillus massiliensis]MDY4048683.1 bifunctional 4-hydroxy-3-methylbut-2-enyl diphosphate reductase/30S ribosomal protein S1 [Negativibacillus massiliensis]